LNYISINQATVDLPCNKSKNFTTLQVFSGERSVSILQIKQFQVSAISTTMFWINERTEEFKIIS